MLDQEQREKILQILQLGGTRKDAATQAKCQQHAIQQEAKRSPEFSLQLAKAENDVKISLLSSVRSGAQKDWRAAVWLLERIWPEEFSGKEMKLEMTKQIELAIQEVGEQMFKIVPVEFHEEMINVLNQLAEIY